MLKPGRVVSDYEVDAEVGAGGIATVYRVVDRRDGAVRALKVLHVQTPTIRERLEFEGQIQSALRHPNIVPVYDVLNVDGWPALVMEYIDGPSLQKWLATHRVKVSTAERLFRGIVDAVALAHEHGLVHRDLKPANILLHTEKGQLVPKVTDFGLARLVLEDQDFALRSRSGIAIGTPGYMALEQLTDPSRVDQRADIFALGCILYELLTGKRAYDGPDVLAIFNRVALGRYIPPQNLTDGLPAHLINAVIGCLHPIRDERIGDCTRLRSVLDGAPLSSSMLPADPADLDAPRPLPRPAEAAPKPRVDVAPPAAAEEPDEAVLLADESASEPEPVLPAAASEAPADALLAADAEPTVPAAAESPLVGDVETTVAAASALEAEPASAPPLDDSADTDAAEFRDNEATLAAASATPLPVGTPERLDTDGAQLADDEPLAALSSDDDDSADNGSDAPMAATVRVFTPRAKAPTRASLPPLGAAQTADDVAAASAGPFAPALDDEAPVRAASPAPEAAGLSTADGPILLAEHRRAPSSAVPSAGFRPASSASGLPLPAGATTGGDLPAARPAPPVDPRDARAAIGRLRGQIQARPSGSNVLPFLGVALITVLAATAGLLYWDKQQGGGRVTPSTAAVRAAPVTAPPVVAAMPVAAPVPAPTDVGSSDPGPTVPAPPPAVAVTEPGPTRNAAAATTPAPVIAARVESVPATDTPASIHITSDAVENFLVPTDPGVSIARKGKGDHQLSAKPGAYTVVARFTEGESPYFIDLVLTPGGACEVTCKETTRACTTAGKCGTR